MDVPAETPNKNTRGQYDPGWNDPPTLSYNTQISSGTKPRNLLNKRVAFPLSNSSSIATQNMNLPPMLPPGLAPINQSPLIPNSPSLIHKCDENNSSMPYVEHDNVTVALSDVTSIINKILNDSPELGNKVDNIRKKLTVMESMWDEGKLVEDIQIKMLKIARALECCDNATADELHKSLMIDHIGSVGPWMVAIKQLIFHCFAKNELLAIDNES